MKAALISFTREGASTCSKIENGLAAAGYECAAFGNAMFAKEAGIRPLMVDLAAWTEDVFTRYDALVFVGACGIAVRAIAPHIKDKTVDPAVVVVDEKEKFAISLLSGHLGGANEIAEKISGIIGAMPVITTATDLNQLFSVDSWAKKNRLLIEDMKLAKEISAKLLDGEIIGVSSDFLIEGELPAQLKRIKELKELEKTLANSAEGYDNEKIPEIGFHISARAGEEPFEKTLHLIPVTVTVGIGCRKGIPPEIVEELFYKILKEQRISVKSIERICSIDIKKEETALIQLAEKLGVPLMVFSADELEKAVGDFSASDFVRQVAGVDNVCERAAVLGSRGELIVRKQARNGVTIALAERTEKLRFS